MQIRPTNQSPGKAAFTLAEVAVCMLVMGLVFAGVLTGNTLSSKRAEWAGYSLAAQAQTIQQLEMFHSATWDTQASPPIDWTTNFPSAVTNTLDIPISGSNSVMITNFITVTNLVVATNPTVNIKMITVNTVWYFNSSMRTYTNTLVSYRAPDQ